MKELNKVGDNGEHLANSKVKEGLGKAAKLAVDFSYIATGEGTRLKDNSAALIGVKKEEPKVEAEATADKIEDKPAEAKEVEQKESEDKRDRNDWEIRDENGELRYEDGKFVYEDAESGKVWENGEEVSRDTKTDEAKVPEVGWRAWNNEGYLRHRYEDGKLVYTDASGRTWVNGEERKKAVVETRSDTSEGKEGVSEDEVEAVMKEVRARAEAKAGTETKVEMGAEAEGEAEVETATSEAEAPKTQAENPAMRRFEKNSQKFAEASETEDVDKKVRLLEEIKEDMPWGGRLWNMANNMLRQIEAERVESEPMGTDEEDVSEEEQDDGFEEEDDERMAMESLRPDDEDLTSVIERQDRFGGGAVERRQTIGERARNWVRRHPKISTTIAAGAAVVAAVGIASAMRGQMKSNRIINTSGPVGIEMKDDTAGRNRGAAAGSNAVSADSLRKNTAGNGGVSKNSAVGNNATQNNNAASTSGNTAGNNTVSTGGNTAGNAANVAVNNAVPAPSNNTPNNAVSNNNAAASNVAPTPSNANAVANNPAPAPSNTNTAPSGGNTVENNASSNVANNKENTVESNGGSGEQNVQNEQKEENTQSGENAAESENVETNKWQPSEDMVPADGGNYWRFNRSDTREQISGTDNWKIGEVEIYDDEGNLTGLVPIISPNGLAGVESIDFNSLDKVTGVYSADGGGQMMFVEYANPVQAGENVNIGEVRILDGSGNVVRKVPIVAMGGDRGITMIDFNGVASADGGVEMPGNNENETNPPEGVPRDARQDSDGRWIADISYGQVNNYSIQVGGETRQIAAAGETQVYDSEGNYLGKTFYLVDGSNLWVPHEDLVVNPVMQAADEGVENENVGDASAEAESAELAQEGETESVEENEEGGGGEAEALGGE